MARLPVPYKDENWGPILNEYLLQAHTTEGDLKANSVGSAQVQDGAIAPSKLGKGSVTIQADDHAGQVLQVVSADKAHTYFQVAPTHVATSVPLVAPNLPRRITTGNTPPANPQDGDIWFDTSKAKV